MCLRYAFVKPNAGEIRRRFGVEEVPPLKARYNIAPNQMVPAIFNDAQKAVRLATWGILPPWAGHGKNAPQMYNARGETVDEKPFFKKAFLSQRCLMLADSFYEWKKPDKTPFQAMLNAEEIFAFAGIYTVAPDEEIRSVCMITIGPNEVMKPVHDRMPVILKRGDEGIWLNGTPEEAKELLVPYAAQEMKIRELTKAINSSRHDGPDVVQAAGEKNILAKDDGQTRLF